MQRYRSGHNEAVLKTVCPRGHVGSNPTLCVENHQSDLVVFVFKLVFGEVPKRLKGLPWKGSRSLIAARGFKSRLLRSENGSFCNYRFFSTKYAKIRRYAQKQSGMLMLEIWCNIISLLLKQRQVL